MRFPIVSYVYHHSLIHFYALSITNLLEHIVPPGKPETTLEINDQETFSRHLEGQFRDILLVLAYASHRSREAICCFTLIVFCGIQRTFQFLQNPNMNIMETL